MGIPIKRIIKTVTKQVPDIVQETADRTAQTVRAVSPTTITTPDINVPDVPTVTPVRTVINKLGVPIGIGSVVGFDSNNKIVGTLFSGDKRYDLSKLYENFDKIGISERRLNNWWTTHKNWEDIFSTLPFDADFKPHIQFTVGTRNPASFNIDTYSQLMKSAGYNDSHIKYIIDNNSLNLLSGRPISYTSNLNLDRNYKPVSITKDNYSFFTPEHIINNMDDDMAENIFYRAMFKHFDPSDFDVDTNSLVFSNTLPDTPHPVLIKASEKLSQKYPGLNFDPSLKQFTPTYSGDNVSTINFWRQKHAVLPFDFDIFGWGQGRIDPKGFGIRGERPQTGLSVYKSLGKLKESVPRGYAVTEINTSPDSEVLKLAMARRNYGTNPKQTTVKIVDSKGSRNTQQNNGVWLEDLINNPQIPQSEKLKLMDIQKNKGVFDPLDDSWLNSESFKQAQILFNQQAIPDMHKLYKGWREIKKLDPSIGDFNISTEPLSISDFGVLLRTGRIAPKIYSPDFHIIKHKNGGSLLNHLQNAIERLKNNNKFGN